MTPRPAHPRRLVGAALLAWVLVLAACTGDEDAGGPAEGEPTTTSSAADPGADGTGEGEGGPGRLQVSRGSGRPAVVDEQGREVLLRGANLNSLGDYFQANLLLPPTRPPTDEDWDQMAAAGFSVVRLLVSWSALEPTRGQVDLAYLQRIQQAVDAAEARGMHTVIDMHQDAWGKTIASPPDVRCPEGTEPAIGWDGAPAWATLTDGADTCRPVGSREGAPAVKAAFTAFYENRDGIRDAFAATWRVLASTFAEDPAVAGYDLLNEPNVVADVPTSTRQYTELVTSVIAQVRAGEAEAGGFPHIVFLEPMVLFPLPGTMPADGAVADDQVVFAPHNYAEVIGPEILTVEQTFDVAAQAAEERGWPLWIGEHGVFSTDAEDLAVLRRFAAAQDAHLAGGAQWQWRQWCGDPHSVGTPGATPTAPQVQLNTVLCPDDVDTGATPDIMQVASRAYPRAAPGRLTELASDPAARTLTVEGRIVDDLATGGDLRLWVPGEERPTIEGDGLGEPTIDQVPGGWDVAVPVTDSPYRVELR